MDIEKMIEVEILLAYYSQLLTEKQREIISMYYEEDYSLGEISSILKISRQSVFDSLKRSEKSLKEYENKLRMVEKSKKINKQVDKLAKQIESLSNIDKKDQNQLRILIEEVRELI
ncbi:YlxM family DNA-binding protein [Peptostreptococcus equinus]|uniref:UPF0122 protein O0R46_05900 n=1 Tax=Peptostreptococcus equinus TaxID=3003601 RepID=A0ABY7JLB1_9FIRM|nr:sigma factor-like helix-turn-helix DNA-binding protein [Peptostreptococcus sp. CBA3647]WAW14139.1 sigma factor-like helix-turn-helix DNA-binding protein [Peptostreptococcus sp. CBA3647]